MFAAIAAMAGAWALWLRQTMAREADLLQTIRVRTEQLEEANRKLEALSYQDALTGVGNRRAFDLAIDREWRRAIRSLRPLSLLMLDIDHFKLFNDRYGHQAGDRALASVAAALMDIVRRAADQVARYGGEEFVALAPETDQEGAGAIATRLRAAVEDLAIPNEGGVAGVVTVSIGYATIVPVDSTTPAELIAAADAALYQAKRAGRNRVVSSAESAV